MFEKLKKRWNIKSNFQVIVILVVFALTGFSVLYVKKAAFVLLGIDSETPGWITVLFYILIVLPAYQIMLLGFGFLFGKFRFFWNFEKKILKRFSFNKKENTSFKMDKKIILIFTLLIFTTNHTMSKELETATLGGGCFWCTEAMYKQLNGVESVLPGYSGGDVKNPAYKEVCTGLTGHAEVVQIKFDPAVVSFGEILEVFFKTHDPTTLNRQGADVGTQYRSAVFYHSEGQKQIAEKVIKLFEDEKVYDDPIVTEVTKFRSFYPAEDYHKDYYTFNKNQPYCRMVVAPKVEKFQKIFKGKLKKKDLNMK